MLAQASAIVVVDDDLTMYMDLAGMVDPAKELKRLTKEAGKIKNSIADLEKKMGKPLYEEKVKEDIKTKDRETLASNKVKLGSVKEAMKIFSEMKK